MYDFKTKGTCSSKIHFDIKDSKIYSVSFEDGCKGNLKALSTLMEGMDVNEAVKKLKGITCGRKGTSCADQFAQAISQHL